MTTDSYTPSVNRHILDSPKVAVILVNWNGLDDTTECLQSLAHTSYADLQIIVVDNASTDGSLAALRSLQTIHLLENRSNQGFGAACNQAATAALQMQCDYLLFLNNDTIVDPGFIEPLVSAFQQDTSIAIAESVIYDYHSKERVECAGAHFDWRTGVASHLHEIVAATPYDIGYACGCAAMVDARKWSGIGMFDPRFFLYYEDVDLSVRARSLGYRVVAVPQSKVWHKGSSSVGFSSRRFYYMRRNLLLLLAKHGSWRQWPAFLVCFVRRFFLGPLGQYCLTGSPTERARINMALAAGWDFVRGHFGECPR